VLPGWEPSFFFAPDEYLLNLFEGEEESMPDSISLLSAFALGAVASAAATWVIFEFVRKPRRPISTTVEASHFDPQVERRGVGTLIKRLNHVALAVSDVGRSLQFYSGHWIMRGSLRGDM
jgi:hypothetical protein